MESLLHDLACNRGPNKTTAESARRFILCRSLAELLSASRKEGHSTDQLGPLLEGYWQMASAGNAISEQQASSGEVSLVPVIQSCRRHCARMIVLPGTCRGW